jgi:2-polyprenyl-3-methyl-5-hydroxy-6-metoxy-1,4-benzoquinol methylase
MEIETQSDPLGFETLETFSQAPAFNRWLYGKISEFAKGQVLEIGSGIGNISTFLLRDQPVVSLSDLRPEYCQVLEKKFGQDPHLQAVYELDLSLPDFQTKNSGLLKKFDTVIALNVVEHIKEDATAIRNAKALLKKNGNMIILVPTGQWLYNPLDQELGHYKRYTKRGLNNLLRSAGLVVINSRYFNATAIFGWWLSGTILKEKIISPGKINFYNRLVPLFRIIDWFVSPFIGISVISVATNQLD